MSNSMLLGMFDWIADFFKALFDLIPKVMYLLYASLACVLDVLQLFFRKLAGLDVYYVDGKAVAGDLVTNFITGILGINKDGFTYSALSTVFWAMVVFGIIMCFMCTIVAIVKSHYSYDDKAAKGPMQYVYTAGKAVINMIAVPIIVVLGLYLSEAILTALDSITSTSSGDIVALYGSDKMSLLKSVDTVKTATGLEDSNAKNKTYLYYDIFGFGGAIAYGDASSVAKTITTEDLKQISLIGASNQTFSGSLFKVAAYNANRARLGQYRVARDGVDEDLTKFLGSANNEYTLFGNAKNDEELADMIDTAFANNLHMDGWHWATNHGKWSSERYFTNFLVRGGWAFSKFNVGLVWYYYDLWQFNFIVGFAGCIVCVTIFINVILGLMTRLFMCVGLFLVAPPLFGLAPLDGGAAGKKWRENFMKQVLMAYGAVLGMNIMFLIMPYINRIDFFNIGIADLFAQTLFLIVGLITIKAMISTLSDLIGGADANKTGGDISEEVGSVAGKATKMTMGAAKIGTSVFSATTGRALSGAGRLFNKATGGKLSDAAESVKTFGSKVGKKVGGFVNKISGKDKQDKLQEFDAKAKLFEDLDGKAISSFDETKFREKAAAAGVDSTLTDKMVNEIRSSAALTGQISAVLAKSGYEFYDNSFKKYNNRRGYNNANYRAGLIKRQGKIVANNKALASAPKAVLDNFGDTFKNSKLYKQFKEDSFWGKEDYAKTTAQNTAAILEEQKAATAHMQQGFETAHADAEVNRTLQELNTKRARLEENVRQAQRRLEKAKAAGAGARSIAGYKAQITRLDNELRDILNEIKRQGY